MRLIAILIFTIPLVAGEPILTADQKLALREAQIEVMKLAPAYNAATKTLADLVAKHEPPGYEIQEVAGKLVLMKKPEPPKAVEAPKETPK